MQRSTFLIVLAVLAALGVVYVFWQQLTLMRQQVTEMSQQVADLGGQVEDAERRAEEAESAAERARRDAEQAADRAEVAVERETQSAEEAEEAEAARAAAEADQRLAEAEKERARREAEEAEAARQAAERKRRLAEEQQRRLSEAAEAAQVEAARARAAAEKMRRHLAQEIDRLEDALSEIADTRRTALGVVMTLDGSTVEFDFDKAELRPQNREVLSKIAGILLTFESYSVQILGHTDDVGSLEYNQGLSEQRADAVREYLVEAGLDPEALTTKGFGKTSPRVEGTDPESRQRNRRVELAIVFTDMEYATTTAAGDGGSSRPPG